MRRSRFRIEDIVAALEEVDDGAGIKTVCYRMGISRQTYNRWRRLYQGLSLEEARALERGLRERRLLRRRIAQLEEEIRILRVVDGWTPERESDLGESSDDEGVASG